LYSSGIEGNPTVFYRLMPGSTAQTNKYHTFYLQQRQDNGDTWADIKVNHPLDYEAIKEYNLTIRVEVSGDLSFPNINQIKISCQRDFLFDRHTIFGTHLRNFCYFQYLG
jgi:hypothetical protein